MYACDIYIVKDRVLFLSTYNICTYWVILLHYNKYIYNNIYCLLSSMFHYYTELKFRIKNQEQKLSGLDM